MMHSGQRPQDAVFCVTFQKKGWRCNVLALQVESVLYQRQGRAVSNFLRALPAAQSELAPQILKDPYTFDFLRLGVEAGGSEGTAPEQGLLAHVQVFLLKLKTLRLLAFNSTSKLTHRIITSTYSFATSR